MLHHCLVRFLSDSGAVREGVSARHLAVPIRLIHSLGQIDQWSGLSRELFTTIVLPLVIDKTLVLLRLLWFYDEAELL